MEEVSRRRALLVIDLQKDFISSNAALKENPVIANHILNNLRTVLPSYRTQNGLVIWIKSDYSKLESTPKYLARPAGEKFENVPMNNARLSGSHHSFPMCIPGFDGQKFVDDVETIFDKEHDRILTKTYYSAFTDTELLSLLTDIDEVHICGLTTNCCVRATATDAFFHGYNVFIWTDCLGYRAERSHHEALKILEQWYAKLVTSKDYFD